MDLVPMAETSDELLKWRAEFPILGRSTYLISNSLGAMPRGVYDSLHGYADTWAERGVRAWEESWWDLAGRIADKVSPLIGAGPGEISLHQNVTTTQAVITSCFDFRGPRNKVVMTELEFPSVQYFYHEQRRHGARVELVPSGNSVRFDLELFLSAIDETTLLVPISLVLFRSAFIVNAQAIIEKAHRVGAHVVLDVFQATGTVPFAVRALGADFATGGVLKWLCGGPGVAYLYVREDLRHKLLPALTGWMAHRRPFQFEPGAIEPRDDSYRFLNGTTHIPAMYAAEPGLDILNKVGLAAIRQKSMRMTARLFESARHRGWLVNTAENPAERGGTVSIDCPHAFEVCRELLAREILVDYRPRAGIRLSPHFYNTQEECDFALSQIDEILKSNAWEKHALASSSRA
jgi:kynureninase